MLGDVIVKTYVFGHKKPDTDSVCSAIAYSHLKNALGVKSEPRVLGDLNKESKYVLKYFHTEEPKYLNDVKVQIKNMSFLKDAYINFHMSIEATFKELQNLSVTGLPIVDDETKLLGYINLKDICKYTINGDIYSLNTSYDNIIESLNATSLLRYDDEFNVVMSGPNAQDAGQLPDPARRAADGVHRAAVAGDHAVEPVVQPGGLVQGAGRRVV